MENASAVIATLSGNLDPQQLSLMSATNMLTVRFRSDEAVQLRGFQATWKAGECRDENNNDISITIS